MTEEGSIWGGRRPTLHFAMRSASGVEEREPPFKCGVRLSEEGVVSSGGGGGRRVLCGLP